MKYRGTFNYYREVTNLWTEAGSLNAARGNMFARIARKYKKPVTIIFAYFNGTDRYRIEEVR